MAASQRIRSRGWCFTINNPTNSKEDVLKLFEKAKCVIIGKEKGEQGTEHFQGYVQYKNAISFNTVKKLIPTAHIESAKGDPQQNYKYCSKDGDFIERGTFEKNGGNSLEENKCLIRGILKRPYHTTYLCDKNYLHHKSSYDAVISTYRYRQRMAALSAELSTVTLFRWQIRVAKRLFKQNDRQILWVLESKGGIGKTWFAKYLCAIYGYDLFDGVTASRDICTQISPIPRGIIFDVTRKDSQHFSYTTLEQCKNGRVMTGKYHGYIREFKPVPVIVFANFSPETSALSADRWDIIDDESLSKIPDQEGTKSLQETYPPPSRKDLWSDGLSDEEEESTE